MGPFTSPTPTHRLAALYRGFSRQADRLQALLALGLRLYVARVFLLSGLTKIQDWSVTLALFEGPTKSRHRSGLRSRWRN